MSFRFSWPSGVGCDVIARRGLYPHGSCAIFRGSEKRAGVMRI